MVGVSADKPENVRRFRDDNGLTFTLIADPGGDVIRDYGVTDEPGPKAKRMTFLIDPDGTVVQVWDQVDVKTHADRVLDTVREKAQAMVP